ncbi:glutamyl-tRNA synthetase [Aulographum hederae CBS 113979]|uniref:Glutamate--tRNA ligase, mitochondrial n=1 Tax=Aulographum hederae CBS 113979 TaxID=1176131 RepID=A0A6G1GSX8_9PEZI|nr:glutamyl-tRNA synthetase [Aulographum hederae CBS 113979]
MLHPPPSLFFTCSRCRIRLFKPSKRKYASAATQHVAARQKLPDSPARTRFAPSPTGYLHLGSLRTALFNYLLAKRTGGQFLLRLEDTDRKRTVADAEKRLYEDLRWAGLQWDEGPEVGGPYGPYRQSERTHIYHKHAQDLLQTPHAYRCFCTSERLHNLASERSKLGLPTDYDRTCAGIPKDQSDERAANGEAHVIRLKVPERTPIYTDIVYGKVGKNVKPVRRTDEAYDDPILLKSDGFPTYHLANVVDDHLMQITHVVRGTEWMNATPKHMALYSAFGWEPPHFAHVGLLVDENGNKLSKRNFDTDVASFRDRMKILPDALTNFVALLGWSHTVGKDLMSMEQLIENFTVKWTKGNVTVSLGKLWFLQNKHAISHVSQGTATVDRLVADIYEVVKALPDHAQVENRFDDAGWKSYVARILKLDVKNYTSPSNFVAQNSHFFLPYSGSPIPSDERNDVVSSKLKTLVQMENVDWTPETLKQEIHSMVTTVAANDVAEKEGGRIVHEYLRRVFAGGQRGPGMADTMAILGREECSRRLDHVTMS